MKTKREPTRRTSREKKKNQPVHEIRLGRVKGTVWENEGEQGMFYSVSFARLYKSDQGWQDSTSFGRDDLPLISKVADQIHTWIFEQSQTATQRNGQAGNGPEGREPGSDDDLPY